MLRGRSTMVWAL